MKSPRYLLFHILGICIVIIGTVVTLAQDDNQDEMPTSDPALVERGHEVFVANACTACHGQNAEGTDIAPALGGHSEFAIRRQVRAPANVMLVFGPNQIPTEDLDALVAYIQSLEMPAEGEHHMHDMSGITIGDRIFAHHWLLWLALQEENVSDAIHHTAHILELLVDGPHKAMMEPVLTTLGEGDLETAKTIVEPMVTDVGDFNHDTFTVGLQLVHFAATTGDQEVALHFATDLTEHTSTDEQTATAANLLELVESCHLDDAAMAVEMELGDDANFVPESMLTTMNMDEDHADTEGMNMEGDHAESDSMDEDHTATEDTTMGDTHSDETTTACGDTHDE